MQVDTLDVGRSFILGIVEGVTEFLPISSTGHLIVAGDLLAFTGDKAKVFNIFIQLGAILAVVWYYRERIMAVVCGVGSGETNRFLGNLFVAFIPVAVVGLLIHSWIKEYLFSPVTVAGALIAGGILILIIERSTRVVRITDLESIPLRLAFVIGLAQVLSLVPGVSRAGATIMGGLVVGFDRKTATEFSFFLAIPTMFAATSYDLLKNIGGLDVSDLPVFATGFVLAFISALVVIKALLRFIARHDFTLFAYYRIVFGIIVLLLLTR